MKKKKSYETVGLGALKYFILKVDPKKKCFSILQKVLISMEIQDLLFNILMRESSRFWLRLIILQKKIWGTYLPNESEKDLIMLLSESKDVVSKAAESLSPALVANYVYELVKTYNSFYQNNPILNQDDENAKQFRLQLSELTGKRLRNHYPC
jgi:arginyl-tRNA synthetase